MKRNRRAGVEDRWHTSNGAQSGRYGVGMRWRARYVDDQGREHAKGFTRKAEAQRWLDGQTAALVSGMHVAPRDAQMTVSQWCSTWLHGYGSHRPSSVRQAGVHIGRITAEFGDIPLSALRPSQVKSWVAKLHADGLADNYVHVLHKRLSQILADAVHDGLLGRNPCSRRTSPVSGSQKPYCVTTEQVWALHDALPDHLRVAVLLGAFAGLRIAEASGLRVADVDFVRGVVYPAQQWGGTPLKTEGSSQPVPIPRELTLLLSASVQRYGTDRMVTDGCGKPCGPWVIKRAVAHARATVDGLPEGFTFHDLRHYLASLLIASGADIKTVQARMRHASASTTLDVYGHLWPDADESTRTAIGAVIAERMQSPADALRTERP
jgi:integrase